MSKHTPGPWRLIGDSSDTYECRQRRLIGDSSDTYECRQIKSADGTSLMGDEQYYPWTPSDIEDWRLISAAPELLDFAKEWLAQQGSDNNYMTQKAKEAIAKAEGSQ